MSFRSFRYYAKKYSLVRRDDLYEAEGANGEEPPAAEVEGA
jgi:hypothetical protein